MSTYNTFTANIDGLMSAVKLEWTSTMSGTDAETNPAVMVSQSIYYTDVYESGDGGLIHDNKVIDLAVDASSAMITGLTSDREYQFTIVGKDNVSPTAVEFEKDLSANPHQLAGIPEFTLEKGDAQFTVKVSNHKDATEKYILFINGNVTDNDKIRTITVNDNEVDNGTWTKVISNGIENGTNGDKSFYEVSVRAVNSVSTSAMSGSKGVEATNALADVTGLEVLTGPERPANVPAKAIVKFNAVPGATKYYIKAFAESKTIEEMITDATNEATDDDDWFFTTNLFLNMNKNKLGGADLDAGTKYKFAVVPYGSTSLSANSLTHVEATPSGKPDTDNIVLEGTGGKDISGGDGLGQADHLTFAQMNGKYQVAWTVDTSVNYLGLGNGLPITALTFSLSGEDDEILKTKVVSGSDLSQNGFAMFEGLTNGNKYEVSVKTTNANGDSDLKTYSTNSEVVSTRPTNFTLIAGPAVGAQDKNKDGSLDISYNMNGNGLIIDRSGDSNDFVFDLSGMDDAIGGENGSGIGLDLDGINGLATAVGKRYIIKARASNANGDASPKELTAIVKPSSPPKITESSPVAWTDSRIMIRETTDLNKIIANFSNLDVTENGYPTTGARVRAVYHDSTSNNAEWSGDWKDLSGTDLSKDVEFNLPTIVDAHGPHTTYKLEVQPFNAVYNKDYSVTSLDAGYGITESGLITHTTPSIDVTSVRLGITELRMTSEPYDMSNSMTFVWRCDAVGTDNLELLVAEGGLNSDDTGYTVPKYSDYKLIGEMSSTKYNADADVPADTEMSFDLSNATASGILLSDSTYMSMSHARSYHFMVREKDSPENAKRAFGVSKTAPEVSNLKFSDYKSRDLITFTVDPKGAKLSSLFLLNNIDPTGDFFFNVLLSGAVPSSIYEKLDSKVSGEINVAIQKDQFQRSANAFPANVLFSVLAGNSTGVTLATESETYQALNSGDEHPIDVAAKALEWAVKAEALADEAEALAATINGQAGNSHGVKDNDNNGVMSSDADDKAAIVREHAGYARGASNDAARYAIDGLAYDATDTPNNGNSKTAEAQRNLAKDELDVLRLYSA